VPALRTATRRWPKPPRSALTSRALPEAKLAPPLGNPLRAKYLYWLFFAPGCIEPAMVQVATKVEMPSVAAGWGGLPRVRRIDKALEKAVDSRETFSAADIAIGSGLNFAVKLFKRCRLGRPSTAISRRARPARHSSAPADRGG